ncbi:MAG: OmpA family protein [Bacteroidales bacterium]|nr:OmpA family protein [Bacteroidales bacterium]
MKHYALFISVLVLGALTLQAQDTTTVQQTVKHRPVNNYSGLNSLMKRLANPSWDGHSFPMNTGLKIDDGTMVPVMGQSAEKRPHGGLEENSVYVDPTPRNSYLEEIERGESPVGTPVFVFFCLAGTRFTDPSQILNVNAAANLAIAKNLRVRIIGAADSATGSAQKNMELANRRSEVIASLMKDRGVPEDRIEVLSEGGIAAYEPVSANRNCRIELYAQ